MNYVKKGYVSNVYKKKTYDLLENKNPRPMLILKMKKI